MTGEDPQGSEPAAERSLTASISAAVNGSGWLDRLHRLKERVVPSQPEYRPTKGRRSYLMGSYVVRRWLIEDRCPSMAAVLTLHTLLSLVPTIGLALLVVGLMDEAAGAVFLHDIFRTLVPDTARAEEMANSALELAGNVTLSNLRIWGFLVTVLIAFALFSTLERTFNQVWRVTRRRHVLVKFTMFYTLTTLGPLLMLFSLARPLLSGLGTALAFPLVTTTIGLTLLNRFLPFTEVRWKAALVGGVISATLLELSKWGFGLYATRVALATWEGVYGSLAILPILLIWSYISWIVILLGAEVAFVVHHRDAIAHLGYVNRYVHDRLEVGGPSGRTAARLLLAVCDQYAQRRIGMSEEELGDRFYLGLDWVNRLVTHLERAGYLIEIDRPHPMLIPALPLDQIRLADVLQMFEDDKSRRAREDRLSALFEGLDTARDQVVGDITFHDLVSMPRTPPPDEKDEQRPRAISTG